MAIERRKKAVPHVESSSMSDIMFFLFLFFLIISTLANPNVIKVPLPDKSNPKPDEPVKNHLTVTIDSEKRYYLDKDEVDIERLESEIVRKTQESGDDMVIIRPAADVEVQLLIDLLQMGLKNNLKFVIGTKGS